jgi:hypothetical protein
MDFYDGINGFCTAMNWVRARTGFQGVVSKFKDYSPNGQQGEGRTDLPRVPNMMTQVRVASQNWG